MAEKKLRSPSTTAGLVRFEEEEESLIQLKPVHVVGIILGLLALEVLLMFIQV